MKKIFAFLLLLYITDSYAQITISNTDMPSPGDTIRTSLSISNENFDFTRTGENYTWDFSGLTPFSQDVDTFISVVETPVAFWPFFITSANLATKVNPATILPSLPELEAYRFYNNTNASYNDVGYGILITGIPLPLKYANADMIYKFPMNNGTTHESASGLEVLIPDMGYIMIDRNRSSIVDGWGSLITPYGTFEVLRLKSIVSEYDSMYIDSLQQGIPLQRNYIEYQWIGKNIGLPLLSATVDEMFGTTAVYVDSIRDVSVGVFENQIAKGFNIFPNPVVDNVNIQFDSNEECLADISIIDNSGKYWYHEKSIRLARGNQVITLPLNTILMPSGGYLVIVKIDNQLFTSRFVK
ncbi:MAG: T9SS type A sorting domain-containing protein [Bacteroidales bacterium]|nr:T9SS type A sorting domain-containing protein [Bacteroidales bacterium]